MQCPLAATRGHQAHGRLEGGRRWLGAECGAGAEAGSQRQPGCRRWLVSWRSTQPRTAELWALAAGVPWEISCRA